MADLDLETIRHALKSARDGGFGEVHLEFGSSYFSAKLSASKKSLSSSKLELNGSASELGEFAPDLKSITAPSVGYYKTAGKGLKVGDRVAKGDIVASITALGLANDVEAQVTGEIVEVLATPEQPVEYGQALATVREA
jgi:acetyl-CoA carboxylase biotin carboxyl carrier protein